MGIKEWPAPERPRERLLAFGHAVLSDAELLAAIVGTGGAGRDAVAIARQALAQAGGLRRLCELSRQEFSALAGFGTVRYVQLQACLELSRRYFKSELQRQGPLRDPAATRTFLAAQFKSQSREVFGVLFLDARHQVIAFEILFLGTLDSATIHPREVVRRALALNAGAVILAHNHPSGIAEPSNADRALTRRLAEALELVDIRVLDHLVFGDSDATSFAERGWL